MSIIARRRTITNKNYGDNLALIVKTDNSGVSNSTQFRLPLISGQTYNFAVDWGDGTTQTITSNTSPTKTYATAGTYTVLIRENVPGGFPGLSFAGGGDTVKLLQIANWGNPTWSTLNGAFNGCSNLTITAADTPNFNLVTDFNNAWRSCTGLTSFPAISFPAGTNFNTAWFGCVGLTSFGLITVPNGSTFSNAWQNCSGLTSFPVISFPMGWDFTGAWLNCTGLTSFGLITVPNGTIFTNTWNSCSSLTSFPAISFPAGTNFSGAWTGCSSLTSFPAISFPAGTNFNGAWFSCTGLTSFPAITLKTTGTISLISAWQNCPSLTSFLLISTQAVTGFSSAWNNCVGLNGYNFPTLDMRSMTDGSGCFLGVALSTQSYSDLLVAINSQNTKTGVTFDGGNSKYNTAGATARAALISRSPAWTITDGGPA